MISRLFFRMFLPFSMMFFLGYPAQASLVDIGNGLIYDSSADVTWISNGLYFSDTFQASGNSLGLIGQTVTPPGGTAHTIDAADFSFVAPLTRELGNWYGATAWANNLQYQYGSANVTGWVLPTQAEATSLWAAVGNYGATNVGPFTYVLPKMWLSDGATATTAQYIDFTGMSGPAPFTGSVALTNLSNLGAVYHGNVANLAAVPVPGAVWLFGSALIGLTGFGRRNMA